MISTTVPTYSDTAVTPARDVGAVAARPRLSVIIPAYNEERRLQRTLPRLDRYLRTLDREAEVIVVENGSTDRTAAVVEECGRRMPSLRLLRVPAAGKGWAVRAGMLAATGEYLMFCDADFSMPVEGIARFTALLDGGAPIVIASRETDGAGRHGEPPRRHLMGRVFNRAVQALIVPGIEDTQCGFKAFRRVVARDLFSLQRTRGWAFDVELLYLARRRGYPVRQVGIDWYYDADSRVRGLPDSLGMMGELLRIRLNGLSGLYRRRRPPVDRARPGAWADGSPLAPSAAPTAWRRSA